MSEQIKAGLIVGVAIIAATGIWVYFSPYQTCLRASRADIVTVDPAAPDFTAESESAEAVTRQQYRDAAFACARAVGRN
jgi:hypothetical protein